MIKRNKPAEPFSEFLATIALPEQYINRFTWQEVENNMIRVTLGRCYKEGHTSYHLAFVAPKELLLTLGKQTSDWDAQSKANEVP